MKDRDRIANALLLLRLGVFIVVLMWTLDKFINPGHSAGVFENFYGLSGWGPTAFMILGALELVLLVGFVIGYMKTYTYGFILVIHAISTLSSWKQLLNPYARLIHHPSYCDAVRPRICGVSLGRASSPDRRVRLRCTRSRNTPATAPDSVSLRTDSE